ncbi:hypothetical protein ACNVED_05145 [Legionella sp. D16C41]|uniref:hypothetical protein n=1 Tax=Legionella sp. D16C41 TaxID=3402688 RepID=UPI003AF53870
MQYTSTVERDIEHLLAELIYCLNALRHFREQWTLNDIQQVELVLADFKQHVSAYH